MRSPLLFAHVIASFVIKTVAFIKITRKSCFRYNFQISFTLLFIIISFQFSSVAQLCLTLCHPMDCSIPGFPVHHKFPEHTQTHVHWVSDVIQPSHPLSTAGSRRETFHSWQRSWGRRLGICKGGIEPRECPRIFSSIYPQTTRVCLLYCFVLSPLTLLGAVPHHHLALSVKELTYSSN